MGFPHFLIFGLRFSVNRKIVLLRPTIIIMAATEISSSGEITSSFENISDVFTAYTEIPSGGFNRLYKAKRYGKWFVLKGLKPEHQHKEVYINLLTKEFELGVKMDHPHIVHTMSLERDPIAGPCIVMEYVDGITLREFLRQRPTRQTRTKIVKEILSAMSYWHSLQVIHRDLKPDNILVTRNGHNVKIIDFGLADSDWHGILKQPAGSDKYSAPEQKAGNVPLDSRADIYAFGIILRQIFPHGYGRIVRKCTRKDRERRFRNADEILSWMDRHKRTIPTLVVLAALAVIGAAAWMFWTKTQEHPAEEQPIETNETQTVSEPYGDVVEKEEIPYQAPSQELSSQVETPAKTPNTVVEKTDGEQIPAEVQKSVEQAVDTLFRRFWDWNKSAEARGLSAVEKLSEYVQSDFFKNNYEIRERHREAVLNDVVHRYPQCERQREALVIFYNTLFANKMIAVNNVVVGWQRAAE